MERLDEVQRRYDLDWLRVIAVALLVPFHTGMIFCFWNFHLKNNDLSVAISVQNAFLSAWHMPLFFFLSGAGSWYALGFRSAGKYAGERVLRLFIPLVFGTLVLCPPQIYFERLQQGAFSGSFLKFYPHFFNGPYPGGNLSWQHLWFLLYLFLMSLIMLPLFRFLKSGRGQSLLKTITAYCSGRTTIYTLILPFLIVQCIAAQTWPNGGQNLIGDLDNFFQYMMVFTLGYALCACASFWETVENNRALSAVAGLVLFAGSQFIVYTMDMSYFGEHLMAGLGWLTMNSLKTWCLLLAVLGYGRKHLNFSNGILKYAVDAALPFYILHQTVIIFIGYYIVQTGWSITAKYVFINITSFIGTLALYDIAVKRLNITRFLFGMRPGK